MRIRENPWLGCFRVNQRVRTDWLLLAGFCGFLFFYGLAYFGLVGADEPRYAQVAREMLARHDWVTPTLGGKPWLEKPPLYYWQAMLAYRFFGVSDWAARLPSAVDATLMVIAIYLFFRRFRPGSELDAALMTVSAAGIDRVCPCRFHGHARSPPHSPLPCWPGTCGMKAELGFTCGLAYAFLALGMLAKGPVAPFLAAVVVGIFAVANGDYGILRRTLSIPGILVFCVIALPWYIAVQVRNPDFFHAFILQHNLERFSSNLYHHREPFWYYIPVVLLALLPWTVFAVAAVVETIRAWWSERGEALKSEDGKRRCAERIPADLASGPSRLFLHLPIEAARLYSSRAACWHFVAGGVCAPPSCRRPSARRILPLVLHAVVAAALVVPALLLGQILLLHRITWSTADADCVDFAHRPGDWHCAHPAHAGGFRMLRFVTLIPVVLAVAAVLRLYAPALDNTLSARPLAIELGKLGSKPLPLAVFHVRRETEFGLAFYRNQTIDRYENDNGQIPELSTSSLLPPDRARNSSNKPRRPPRPVSRQFRAPTPGLLLDFRSRTGH